MFIFIGGIMNFKIKLLLMSVVFLGFQKTSSMQVLNEIGSSAIAGAAARTLVFENLPGFFIEPGINKEKNNKNLEFKNKMALKKWAHCGSAVLNLWNILLAYKFIFKYDENMNQRAHAGIGKLFFIPALIGMGVEREIVNSLKDIKMIKKHEDVLNISMPLILASLQYMVTQN